MGLRIQAGTPIRLVCSSAEVVMAKITKPRIREIIDDFAKEIKARRLQTAKPSKEVINFRNDRTDLVERDVWRVPIEILRYRKDNGRIASDVLDYERNVRPLDEKDDEAQSKIREFLARKDPEKTHVLRQSIMHAGQQDPAIITCDGFLINGNRRKMVMDALYNEDQDEKYQYMKAVILPGHGDPGGPPSLLEIEQIENRYQLQSDGKSEYYGFDRALSIKRKVEIGLSLEAQLRDDPRYAGASQAEIAKAVKRYDKDYLRPLSCVDRYLRQFRREGLYRTISGGMTDREGRWQAFIDYSNTHDRYFRNPKKLVEYGIEEDEIGEIEEAAFNIIRLRTLPDLPKAHVIMRNLPKYCGTREGKKALKDIARKVDPVLADGDCLDQDDNPLPMNEIDAKWSAKSKTFIMHGLRKAVRSHEAKKDKETPIDLLRAALKKLTHDDMDLSTIQLSDLKVARKLTVQIKNKADNLETEIYHHEKNLKKLTRKKS